ncbi:Dimethylmenaquinone methyltransferase [Methanobacterium lacus]|jgi:3-hexulose-6-phosphate synthase|uniref:Dimethylmenaquinone methyltransferase n=1 Tax=Methanobacterium lacus (strain AL-21) TaxID=877455 RepID=F0T639_METLA|nr:RraA family protein [Methanobacterium lacus]ADZ10546.1 Dimethylmenaquinone methyltransferase [Methanobacterium lacus]
MDGKQKLSPETFLKKFASKSSEEPAYPDVTTSQFSDALTKLTGKNGVLVNIKPIDDFKIIGRATTVKTSSNDWGTVIKGIYSAKKGDVLVISCEDDQTAVWGELASEAAKIRGLSGTVVIGASRDSAGIKSLKYPVFSRNVVPNAGKPLTEGEININLTIEDTIIKPGDLIIGDECGVVSVDQKMVSEVMKVAMKIVSNETEISSKLNQNISFMEILGIK